MHSVEEKAPQQCRCPLLPDGCDQGRGLIQQLLELIADEDDFNFVCNELLRYSANYFAAERCYIFQYGDNEVTRAKPLFIWQRPDAEALLALPELTRGNFNGYRNLLIDHQMAHLRADELPNDERISKSEFELFQESGVSSRLICGIWIDDRLHGFIGFDRIGSKLDFPEWQVVTIKSIVNLFRLIFKKTHQHVLLQESLLLQRQIMDNLDIPILLVDLNYQVRAANPTKKINVEVPLSKLIGTYCYDTVCKFGKPPDFCSVQETMQTRKPSRREFSFGEKRLISTAQPIFDRHGNMQYVLSVDIDITEVTRQKEELKIAMEQAQSANYAKSYFLATVSHELRTPLNAVIGFSELLQSGSVDTATQREYLQSINFAGTALLNLINDVLDLSNLEANQTLIAPERSDVADMIHQVLAVFKLKCMQKGIDLIQDTAGLHYQLFVDNLRLRQILLNLIGNAIKFTTKGSVTVRGNFTPTDETHGNLELQVIDTGVGISAENQEKIFEPFVHDSVIRGSRMYEGSGLGLTISRRLLDKMGGKITLKSEVNQGSIFTINLQVQYDRELPSLESAAIIATEASAPEKTPKRKLQLLLVDDVPINLKVLEAMLKQLGIESVAVGMPEKAVEILRKNRNFDLILTDMWMPGCNGLELVSIIRRELGITDIPIWAVTADTQVTNSELENFDGILYKPITRSALQNMLLNAHIPAERPTPQEGEPGTA